MTCCCGKRKLSAKDRATLGRIEALLVALNAKEDKMALDFGAIQAAVAQETTVTQSAIVLLQQIGQMVKDAGTNQAALDQVTGLITQQTQALADAVTANTSAAAPAAPTAAPTDGSAPTS